jgi:hypothetical protein
MLRVLVYYQWLTHLLLLLSSLRIVHRQMMTAKIRAAVNFMKQFGPKYKVAHNWVV